MGQSRERGSGESYRLGNAEMVFIKKTSYDLAATITEQHKSRKTVALITRRTHGERKSKRDKVMIAASFGKLTRKNAPARTLLYGRLLAFFAPSA